MIREGDVFFQYRGKNVVLDYFDKVASTTSNFFDNVRLKFIWNGVVIKLEHSENKYTDMTRDDYFAEIRAFIKMRIEEVCPQP